MNLRTSSGSTDFNEGGLSSTQRSALTWAAIFSLFAVLINYSTIVWLVGIWNSNPDYSHGFFVPLISGYLLYHRRELLNGADVGRNSLGATVTGIVLIVLALMMKLFGIYSPIITLEAFSLIPMLLGIVVLCAGFKALYWAAPAILFLVFMIPLPRMVSSMMSGQLQNLATICATYALQTLGVPAISNGNIITLSDQVVGVAEACSGIRMLYSFFALSVGLCLVIDRPIWERIVLCLSAGVIAVLANLFRIVVTALAYEYGDPEFAEKLFHDFAGWMMMPLAMILLWLELQFLSRVFIEESPRTA